MENQWLTINVHPSWSEFLSGYRLEQLTEIKRQVGEQYNPAPAKVLRFLQTDLENMQVVILGQDPYPQPGVATGRAFEVGGLQSWLEPFPQTSLRNIVRLLYRTDKGIDSYEEIPSFKEIRKQISAGSWMILPPDKLFSSWEEQGVLLLNTCLTVCNKPLQHQTIWLDFTRDLLQFISCQRTDLAWFLWGKHAQEFAPWIEMGTIYPSRHPMMCSSKYDDDFLKAECFQETSGLVNWLGDNVDRRPGR